MDKLRKPTQKQELFCRYHIIEDLNGTKAYLKAYSNKEKPMKESVARANASKLLAKDNVSYRIDELKAERNKRLEINADWVLKEAQELLKIAKGEKPHIQSVFVEGRYVSINTLTQEEKTQLTQKIETHEKFNTLYSHKWTNFILDDGQYIRVKENLIGEYVIEVMQAGAWHKQQVCKTNIKEANNILNTIGKHTKIKAFDAEVEINDNTVYVVGMPKVKDDDEKTQ